MLEKIICAGFGGQGVMLMGQLLSHAGMIEGKEVSWLPSYGPEMRGGTANCNVVISDTPVASPVITDDATCAIIMNGPSLEKFESSVVENGMILVNSSLIERKVERKDVKVHYIPVNDIAIEIGNDRVANIVMVGAYIKISGILKYESVIAGLKKSFSKKPEVISVNESALQKGMEAVFEKRS